MARWALPVAAGGPAVAGWAPRYGVVPCGGCGLGLGAGALELVRVVPGWAGLQAYNNE